MESTNGAVWRESLVPQNWRRWYGVSSFASRMIQRIFVGHYDRTRTILRITKNGIVRSKSWKRQTLSDAWNAANWDGLCDTPWQMVAPAVKLTKKVTADKKRADPYC